MKNKLKILISGGIITGFIIGPALVFAQPQPLNPPSIGGSCQIDVSTGKCVEKEPATKPPQQPAQQTNQSSVKTQQSNQGWWYSSWIRKYWQQWTEKAGKAIKHLGESWAEFYKRLSGGQPGGLQTPFPSIPTAQPTPSTQSAPAVQQNPLLNVPPSSGHVPRAPGPECYDPYGGGLIPGCE